MKKTFLNNEIWILTFGGAFQRANVYSQNYPEKTRTAFRKALRKNVEELVAKKYQKEVTGAEHIKNIKSIITFSKELIIEGATIPINFGVAQKMLNLYLKYLWCLGALKFPPPHFPVDRIIQLEFNKIAKENKINKRAIMPWTQFKDETNYNVVIDFAKEIKGKVDEYDGFSLAQLELTVFDRN